MTLWAPNTAAKVLGISVSRLGQLDREGRLRALRDSAGRRFYEPNTVEKFAVGRDKRRQTSPAA